jgi:23S rRNA C2498 (ribose-2'-O)-methylase RlmM
MQLPFTQSATNTSSWNGTGCALQYTLKATTASTYKSLNESMNLTLSSDGSTVEVGRVVVEDTTFDGTTSSGLHWHLVLKHLALFAVTDAAYIYAVLDHPRAEFVTHEDFLYNSVQVAPANPCGNTVSPVVRSGVARVYMVPSAYVIFSKQ